jgi:hypothetical protein
MRDRLLDERNGGRRRRPPIFGLGEVARYVRRIDPGQVIGQEEDLATGWAASPVVV